MSNIAIVQLCINVDFNNVDLITNKYEKVSIQRLDQHTQQEMYFIQQLKQYLSKWKINQIIPTIINEQSFCFHIYLLNPTDEEIDQKKQLLKNAICSRITQRISYCQFVKNKIQEL